MFISPTTYTPRGGRRDDSSSLFAAGFGRGAERRGMIALLACALLQDARSAPPENGPLHRTVELARGECAEVELWNGRKTQVKLLELGERRDAWARVEIDGEELT